MKPDAYRWIGPATGLVLAVTALRVALLAIDQKQLFVDESQYWLWGQHLDWGYFSKPPLIAWTIRLVTDLAGSDAAFWVRLPAPILHGVTAFLLGLIAARLAGGRAAVWTVAAYLSLPLIAAGSLLMTTDTLMFPFLAGAYLAWMTAVSEDRRGRALLAGALVGIATLAKYAALYFVGAAALGAFLVPASRPSLRVAALAATALAAVVAPNVIWNVRNGLITLQHTIDNIEWARAPQERLGLEWVELLEFAVAQVGVFGPIFLAALVLAAVRWRAAAPGLRTLLLFSWPIILAVCVQALLSRAYANWAAAAYLAGTVAAVLVLLPDARGWLATGVALNVAVAIAIAAIVSTPSGLPEPLRRAVMDRYLGRTEMSREILSLAEARGVSTVVAAHRDILADLFYTGRDSDLLVRAVPPRGPPPNHFALTWPFEGSGGVVLYIDDDRPDCLPEGAPVATLAPSPGYWETRPQRAWIVPGDCWRDR